MALSVTIDYKDGSADHYRDILYYQLAPGWLTLVFPDNAWSSIPSDRIARLDATCPDAAK
jgi:hypothetical protein